MFSHSPYINARKSLKVSGFFLTVFLFLGMIFNVASGQTLIERLYDPETDSLSVRMLVPVDPADSIAKGDHNYRLQFGLLTPDGYKIIPNGASTNILTANCGYTIDEQTGFKVWEIYWHFYLGLAVPASVDLQLCLVVQTLFGKVIWEGDLGTVFSVRTTECKTTPVRGFRSNLARCRLLLMEVRFSI